MAKYGSLYFSGDKKSVELDLLALAKRLEQLAARAMTTTDKPSSTYNVLIDVSRDSRQADTAALFPNGPASQCVN